MGHSAGGLLRLDQRKGCRWARPRRGEVTRKWELLWCAVQQFYKLLSLVRLWICILRHSTEFQILDTDCFPKGLYQSVLCEWVKMLVFSLSPVVANLLLLSVVSLCDPIDYSPPGSSVHRDSPGQNTGLGCHFLLQGIFLTQESNPGLQHCRSILYCLSHQGRAL